MHDPDHTDEVAEARRLGGVRRRRERTLAGAYELGGVRTVDDLLRVVEIAVFDLLGAENSVARAGALLRAALVGARLIEVGDLATRIAAIEAIIGPGRRSDDDTAVFPAEPA